MTITYANIQDGSVTLPDWLNFVHDKEEFNWIPDYTLEAIFNHVGHRQQVGHFVTALLCNNLKETFNRADSENVVAIRGLVTLLHCHIPAIAWGSESYVEQWLTAGRN